MNALDETLLKDIKIEVYSQLGMKLSDQDPLFALLLANQQAMRFFSRPIIDAVESIPSLFEASLDKVATAVEEAEKTTDQLVNETKSNLYALCKVELDAAHLRLKEGLVVSIDQVLKESLAQVSVEVSDLERRVKGLSSNIGVKKAFMTNVLLSVSLLATLSVSAVAIYGLYSAGASNLSDARSWRAAYDSQREVIDKLPPQVRKQFDK